MKAHCFNCGKDPADHWHHVVPKSKGGTAMVPLCVECHAKVHNRRSMSASELTKEGLRKAKARGVKLGGPKLSEARKKAHKAIKEAKKERNKQYWPIIKAIINDGGGSSLRRIAECLNSKKVKTPRNGKWTATSVRRVIASQYKDKEEQKVFSF